MARFVDRTVAGSGDAETRIARRIGWRQHPLHSCVRRECVRLDEQVRQAHHRLKQSVTAYVRHGSLLNLLTTPLIYSLIVPLAILDLWTTVYQWVCFPIYGVRCVPRSAYFVIDRHRLAYLNGVEKMNCTFCSYANGLIAYVREIAARTEQYWCPIKHGRTVAAPHQRYRFFVEYGDAQGYPRQLDRLRRGLRKDGWRAPRRVRPPDRRHSRS